MGSVRSLFVCLLTVLSITSLSPCGRAEEESASLSVADDEIYLDARSGELGAPLPFGKSFKVVTIVPAGSTATLRMKDTTDSSCPATIVGGTTVSGAPVGGPVGGEQKLSFKLGKLFPDLTYCFQLKTVEKRPMNSDEQLDFARELRAGIARLVRQRIAKQPSTPEQLHACVALGATPGSNGKIEPCEIAFETTKALPPRLSGLKLYSDTLHRELTFEEALYRELQQDSGSSLRGVVQELKGKLANRELAETTFKAALNSATPYATSLGTKPYIYDPIPEVTAAALCPSLNGAADPGKSIKGEICAPGVERPAFVSGIYKHGTDLATAGVRTALPAAAEAALKAFLQAPKEAAVIDLGAPKLQSTLVQLANTNRVDMQVVLVEGLVTTLNPLGDAGALGWRDQPAPGDLTHLQGLLKDVTEMQRNLNKMQQADQIEGTLKDDDSFKAFVAQFALNRVFLGKGGMAQAREGATEELFPFYASLDVGAAALGFAKNHWAFGQYFGVNFYFVPVDPSERLYSRRDSVGRGIGRRVSVTLGITTNGSSIETTRHVKGLVGSQMLLSGAGIRVLEFLRVSGGLLWFLKDDNNPLLDSQELRIGGYASLSLDLAAFTLIAKGYNQLTTGKD